MLLTFSETRKYLDRRGGKYYRTIMSTGNPHFRRILKKQHKTASAAVDYGRLFAARYRRLLAMKKPIV